MLPHSSDQTNLSADVAPFVPRKEFQNDSGYAEQGPSPLPRYVTTCYPFVQEQQNGRVPVQPQAGSQYIPLSYITDSNSIHPSSIPTSHNPIVVPVIPPNGFAAHAGDGMPLIYNNVLRQAMPGHQPSASTQKHRGPEKASKRISRKNVATQKEVTVNDELGPNNDTLMVDSSQQTDFPVAIATKSLKERPSPLKKIKSRRHRSSSHVNAEEHESSSDYADADVDSDSGYYSPKHRMVKKRSGGTSTNELTAGFSNMKGGNSSTPVSRVVYLTPSPTLYQVQPHLTQQMMSGVLSPHPTPPPGSSLLLTPPATPLLNQNPSISRPPPGFPPPPNFMKSQWMNPFPSPQSPFAGPHFPHHLVPPAQYYQFVNQRGRNRRPNSSPTHQMRWQSPQHSRNMQSPSMLQDINNDSSFDKRKIDKRKMTLQGMMPPDGQNVPFENGVPMTSQESSSILLADTQEFPGLGSPSVVNQMLLVSNHLSYSDAVLGKTIMQQPPHAVQLVQGTNTLTDDQSMQEKLQAQKNRKRQKKAERASKAADEEYAEISQEQENIQKALKKTAANRNRNKPSKLDLGEILSQQLKSKVVASKNEFSENQSPNQFPRNAHANKEMTIKLKNTLSMPVNPLDSSSPMVKRGKERENPKPKKPSALKKVILKEREEKKGQHLIQLTSLDQPDRDVPPYPPAIIDTLKSQAPEDDMENMLIDNITTVPQIHSRRYREYCSQVLDKRIDEACTIILQKLVQFQDRLYQKDPMKAKMRRRLVMGIREVTKHLKLKKLKCVIVSPNLEKIQAKGGLDEALQQILEMCEKQKVTYVFALGRKAMGRAVSKLVPVSVVGIFDYSGAEDHYKEMCLLVIEAQQKYKEMVSIYQQEVIEAANTAPKSNAASAGGTSKRFSHMGHSRNPSAASCVSFASFISEPISEMNEGSNWRAIMDAQEDQSALSPPPEVGSSDEEPESSRISGSGVLAEKGEEDREVLCRKDSGSTVVECKDAQLPGATDEQKNESKDHSCSLSSIHEDVANSASKNLDKSFSNSSTVVGALHPPGADATPTRGQKVDFPEEEIVAPEASAAQDRVKMWLESTTQSVQDLNLAPGLPGDDEGGDEEQEDVSSLDAEVEDMQELTPDEAEEEENNDQEQKSCE